MAECSICHTNPALDLCPMCCEAVGRVLIAQQAIEVSRLQKQAHDIGVEINKLKLEEARVAVQVKQINEKYQEVCNELQKVSAKLTKATRKPRRKLKNKDEAPKPVA